MPIIKLNQFYGGFALDKKLGLPQQCADTSMNLDIYHSPGILRPNKLMEDDETGAADAAVSDFWAASDDKVYAVGKVGGAGADKTYTRLYVKTDADAAWGTAASGTAGTFVASRMWEYKDYIYWWGKDNTVYSYGPLSGAAAINEAANSITATDQSGPMIECRGILLVAYDNKLASYDGSTWTDEDFTLPAGWLIKSLAIWDKYVAVGAVYDSGYAKISRMFFWDTSADEWEFSRDLPAGELKGLRNVGNRIVGVNYIDSFHASEYGGIAIWEWAGGAVETVRTFEKINMTLTADDQIKDSEIDVKENVFYFAANLKGTYRGLYSWGEPIYGGGKALMLDRYLRTTAETVSYALAAKFIGNYLFVSLVDSSSGTDYMLTKTLNGIRSDSGYYDSLVLDGGDPHLEKEIKKIVLRANPLPTNPSITLSYKVNGATSWTQIGTWTTAAEVEKVFTDVSGTAFNRFNELELRLLITTSAVSSGTPEITDIQVFWEPLKRGEQNA